MSWELYTAAIIFTNIFLLLKVSELMKPQENNTMQTSIVNGLRIFFISTALILGVVAMGASSNVIDLSRSGSNTGAYGAMYIEGNETVSVTPTQTFVKITGFSSTNLNNMELVSDGLKALSDGVYKIDYSLSFSGQSNEEYEITLFSNTTELVQCAFERKLGVGGDVGNGGASCITAVAAEEIITVQIKDLTNTGNVVIEKANLAALELDNNNGTQVNNVKGAMNSIYKGMMFTYIPYVFFLLIMLIIVIMTSMGRRTQ